MAAADLQSGVCESLTFLVYLDANASASDFIQNLGSGTVIDLKKGMSAAILTYPV
jgi:hypothetical protein